MGKYLNQLEQRLKERSYQGQFNMEQLAKAILELTHEVAFLRNSLGSLVCDCNDPDHDHNSKY